MAEKEHSKEKMTALEWDRLYDKNNKELTLEEYLKMKRAKETKQKIRGFLHNLKEYGSKKYNEYEKQGLFTEAPKAAADSYRVRSENANRGNLSVRGNTAPEITRKLSIAERRARSKRRKHMKRKKVRNQQQSSGIGNVNGPLPVNPLG